MNNLSVKSVEFKGLVFHDKDNEKFTVMLVGEDGPVVSADTLDKAKKSFENAMDAYCSMKNVMAYRRALYAQERAEQVNITEQVKRAKDFLKERAYSYEYANEV